MKIFLAIFAILAHFFVFGQDILMREETREEKVRYEILTLNSLYEMIYFVFHENSLKWPVIWYEPKQLYRQAAEETVGDLDSECLKSAVIRGGKSAFLYEDKPNFVWPHLAEHKPSDPKLGALAVWRAIIAFEPLIRYGCKDKFEWMYSGFPEGYIENPNSTLHRAVNTLHKISFERSSEVLLEVQLFFAMRTIRCLYLWNPDERAESIESFIVLALKEISQNWADDTFINVSKDQIKAIVLDVKTLNGITTKIFE